MVRGQLHGMYTSGCHVNPVIFQNKLPSSNYIIYVRDFIYHEAQPSARYFVYLGIKRTNSIESNVCV